MTMLKGIARPVMLYVVESVGRPVKDEEKNGLKTDPVRRMTVREEDAVTAECAGVAYVAISELFASHNP